MFLFRCSTIFLCIVFMSACDSENSGKACFEAERAYADSLEKYLSAPEQHASLVAARKGQVSAAIEWKKKACSND